MNSLPLMTEIIRPGEASTMIIFDVLPVAQFANTMYWHDTKDKSLISLGSLQISRVYHCTYASFMKRISADETALLHYDGTYVINDQIVTVIEFVAQIGFSFEPRDRKEDDASLTATAWPSAASTFLSLKKAAAVFSWKEKQCKTCSEYSGVKDSTLKSSMCATCGDFGSNWSSAITVSKPAARPEPENIDETPKGAERRCETCNSLRPRSGLGYDCEASNRPLECVLNGFLFWEPKK